MQLQCNCNACVVVEGTQSLEMMLEDMVFQGTVLGPVLWNLFFEDARSAINDTFFTEVVYADGLNAYRIYGPAIENEKILKNMDLCQNELHTRGDANQVAFDAAKESKHIFITE